ncbi:MAG: hypothetical protein WC506_03080 [Candidatus Micrarchaeia archaeon]
MTFPRSQPARLALFAIAVSLLLIIPASFCALGGPDSATGPSGPAQIAINILSDGRASVYMNTTLGDSPADFDFWVSAPAGPVNSVSAAGAGFSPVSAQGNPGTVARFQNVSGTIQSAFYLLNPLTVASGSDVYSLDLNLSFSREFAPVSILISAPANSTLVSTSGLAQSGNSSNAALYVYPQALAGDTLSLSFQLRPDSPGMFAYAKVVEAVAPPKPQVSGNYSVSLSTQVAMPLVGKVPLYAVIVVALFIFVCAFFVLKALARARSSMRPDDPDRPWTFESPSDYPEQDSGVKEVLVSPQEGIVAKSITDIVKKGSSRAVFADSPKWQAGPEKKGEQKQVVKIAENKGQETKTLAKEPSKPIAAKEAAGPVGVTAAPELPAEAKEEAKPVEGHPHHGKVNMVRLSMPHTGKPPKPASVAVGYFAKLFGQKEAAPEPKPAALEPKKKPEKKPAPAPGHSSEALELIAEVRKFRSGIQMPRLKKYMLMKPAAFSAALDSAVSSGSVEIFEKNGVEYARLAGRGKAKALGMPAKPKQAAGKKAPVKQGKAPGKSGKKK